MSVIVNKDGLWVQVGTNGSYRKLRAAQNGLYFWDEVSQQVILDSVGEFLPHVREIVNDGNSYGVFQKVVDGKEVCSTSSPIASEKLPRELLASARAAVSCLRGKLNSPALTPEARLLIEKFTLPDPARLPECYRIYRSKSGKKLIILWGCENTHADSIAPDLALSKLPRESALAAFLGLLKWPLLALLLLCLIALLIGLIMAWPKAKLQVSKQIVEPADSVRVSFDGSKGNEFELAGPNAIAQGRSGDYNFRNVAAGVDADWLADMDRASSVSRYMDLSYASVGQQEVRLTAKSKFLGFELPSAIARAVIEVQTSSSYVEPTPAPRSVSHAGRLAVEVRTPPGEFPADVVASSTEAGEIDFGGQQKAQCLPNEPVKYDGFERPGRYAITFIPAPGSRNPKYDQAFVRLDPKPGASPLVANLRLSCSRCKTGDKVGVDTSASCEADGNSSIVSRELSTDNGTTFSPIQGDYYLYEPKEPVDEKLVLRIKDSSGRVSEDSKDLNVEQGSLPKSQASESPGSAKEDSPLGPETAGPGGSITVQPPSDVLFDTGSAELSEDGKQRLKQFGDNLVKRPFFVEITGHTDNRPITTRYPNNMALSQARADAAKQVLITECGIPTERIITAGKGDKEPTVANSGEANRARNRRIVITVIPLSAPSNK